MQQVRSAGFESENTTGLLSRIHHWRCVQREGLFVLMVLAVLGVLALPSLIYMTPLLGAVGSVVYLFSCVRTVRAMASAATNLRRMEQSASEGNDPRLVGELLEALDIPSGNDRNHVLAALARLLPRLRKDDEDALNDDQRSILRRMVVQSRDIGLTLSALMAYRTIGGARERGIVKMLAYGILTHTRDPRVQAAAQDCSKELDERLERERAGRILVRPVGAKLRLLRPVSECTTQASSALPRPADAIDLTIRLSND